MKVEAIDELAAAARRPGSRWRLGKRNRQLHGLGLGVGERIGLVVDRIASGIKVWKCRLAFANEPTRWIAVTAPVWPPAMPR